MATRTDPQFKKPDAPQVVEGEEAPRPRFEDRVEFEALGKYEEITLPPHARLQWLSAKLPSAPPEVLQDTVPPNGAVKAPPKPVPDAKSKPARAPMHERSVEPAAARAPARSPTDPLTEQETMLIPRVRRKQRLRSLVLGAVALAAGLVVIALLLRPSSPDAVIQQPDEDPSSQVPQPNLAEANSRAAVVPAPTASPSPREAQSQAHPRPSVENREPARPAATGRAAKTTIQQPAAKPPSTPVTSSKPTPAPGTAAENGSAFDGLMRPPSD